MNEIEVKKDTELSFQGWQTLKEQCTAMVKSGFLPSQVNTPEKAMAIALAGRELGIGMMESFRSINVILGKPTVSPQLMLALANRRGELEDMQIDSNASRCIITIKRKGRSPHTEEFGAKEATALGLILKDNYRKQPAVMFKWRCLAANLRVTFPDVVLGLYTPEELGGEPEISNNSPKNDIKLADIITDSGKTSETPPPSLPEPENEEVPVIQELPAESNPSEPKEELFEPSITDKQRRFIFFKAKEKMIDNEKLKAYLINDFSIEHTKDLKMSQVNDVLRWIEEQ